MKLEGMCGGHLVKTQTENIPQYSRCGLASVEQRCIAMLARKSHTDSPGEKKESK